MAGQKLVKPLAWTLLACGGRSALAAWSHDFVSDLPGYGAPPSRMWSGFLDAAMAEPGTQLHYWYAEAEAPVDPATAPVVLWLNGGPGSSSIMGMLQENGPLIINATGGLMRNPYAWTKQANLLVLESPAGVGYSYCRSMFEGVPCSNTDDSTAAAARAALEWFFIVKFTELIHNDFFIAGESYAGVYIPTLAQLILDFAPEINLKGIAVGDPCTDNAAQKESMDMMWYSHKNGFLPDDDFDFLWNTCNYRHPSFLASGAWRREQGTWAAARPSLHAVQADAALETKCKVAHRKYLMTTSRGLSQSWPKAYLNELDLFADAAALDWTLNGTLNYYTAQWMNSPAVKKALHVEAAPVLAQWPGPADGWQYTSQYSACNPAAPPGTDSMVNFYRRIAPRLNTTIVFNGDTDPCVTYEGTRVAIQQVGFPVRAGGAYRPWFFEKKATALEVFQEKPGLFGPNLELRDAGVQFGGQVVDYEHNLSFVTVHGSGHMVPQFRPQAAEMLLKRLLTRTAFSPDLPSDSSLADLAEADFDARVDQWTEDAKAYASQKAMAPPSSSEHVFVV